MRRKITAVVLAVLVFSLIAASAASLGGMTNSELGADTDVVASCDQDGVNVDFGTPTYNAGVYEVDQVTVSGINDACQNLDISVTVADGSNNALGSGTDVVSSLGDGDNATTFNLTPADAESIENVAVVISG